MYATVLILHSWIRWGALITGVGAVLAALNGGAAARAERWGRSLTMMLDLQMLLGLLLYLVVSPNMQMIRANFGEAMQSRQLRFWAMEHITAMVVAVVLAHVGTVLARKASTPSARRTRQLICYGLSTLLMIVATPWPGFVYGRPLLRW